MIILVGILSGFTQAGESTDSRAEYKLKAVFLFNFTQFIEWPPSAFESSESPFVIGILGSDPFEGALAQTFELETVLGRKILIKLITDPNQLERCQLLFVPKNEKKQIDKLIAGLENHSGLLTVGETEGFTEQGGGINFFLEKNKLRFEINVEALRRSGLEVSSKLLRLAKLTEVKPGER